LNEFFDLIKQEFETVAQDSSIWKAQRDEYEAQSELGDAGPNKSTSLTRNSFATDQ
jgi:hypothetical protein